MRTKARSELISIDDSSEEFIVKNAKWNGGSGVKNFKIVFAFL